MVPTSAEFRYFVSKFEAKYGTWSMNEGVDSTEIHESHQKLHSAKHFCHFPWYVKLSSKCLFGGQIPPSGSRVASPGRIKLLNCVRL